MAMHYVARIKMFVRIRLLLRLVTVAKDSVKNLL